MAVQQQEKFELVITAEAVEQDIHPDEKEVMERRIITN